MKYNVAHGLHGADKVNDALVDAHFKTVPGLATLTTGSLASGDAQVLGGHAGGSAHLDLDLGTLVDDVAASYTTQKKRISSFVMGVRLPCSRALTLREVRVMRMGKVLFSTDSSKPGLTTLDEATSVAILADCPTDTRGWMRGRPARGHEKILRSETPVILKNNCISFKSS